MKTILQLSMLLMATFSFGQTPISIFNFENTMSNTANTSTFVGLGANQATNTSFGNDRAGRANAALVCTGGGTSYQATIANLPTGNTARTISFWFRSDNTGQDQHIFSYGASTTNQAHGYSIYWSSTAGNTSSYYGFGNDMNNNIPTTAYGQGVWYLYVCVFDGTTASIFRNGNQLSFSNRAGWNTALSNVFGLGRLINGTVGFAGAIDDLKIYNVALTTTQIVAINNHRAADIRASATLARETNITTSSATLNYRVDAGNLPTNVTINYGTTAGNLTNVVTISSNLVNSALTERNYVLTALNPDTVYYYTLTSQNESGSTVLAERSFRTAANFPTSGLIAYFPFENGLSSHDNSHSFTTVSATTPTFATGQVGNGIMFNNDSATGNSTAIVNNATINTALNQFDEYSVAFWVDNMVSSLREPYPTFLEMFSSIFVRQDLFTSATAINRGYANPSNQFFASNTSPGINTGLQHVALVHKAGSGSDRINCALYINGVFINTISDPATVAQVTRFHTKVSVGGGLTSSGGEDSSKRFRGIIDELYFYNRAISPGEVLALMNNSNQTLGKKDFQTNNFEFSIYPNPANKILNVDTAQEIKSVEIYSLLGHKLLIASTKEINISSLSKGVYMVRVEDKKGTIQTQKLIKE